MRKILGLAALCIILLSGCATAYQKNGFGAFTGGYSETQLGGNIFRVAFRGNGYTSSERSEDFCLLRCADLTLTNGFSYFVVIESSGATSLSTYTTPTQSYTTGSAQLSGNRVHGNTQTTTYGGQTFIITKPRNTNVILCFREKPDISGLLYDASFIESSIRGKYSMPDYGLKN